MKNKNKWNKRKKNTIYEIHVSFFIISSISILVEALLALSESISFFNIFWMIFSYKFSMSSTHYLNLEFSDL